jgi:hypothetical protein
MAFGLNHAFDFLPTDSAGRDPELTADCGLLTAFSVTLTEAPSI